MGANDGGGVSQTTGEFEGANDGGGVSQTIGEFVGDGVSHGTGGSVTISVLCGVFVRLGANVG